MCGKTNINLISEAPLKKYKEILKQLYSSQNHLNIISSLRKSFSHYSITYHLILQS